MVFCVYVDPDGFVFDWDWIKEDAGRAGYPEDYHLRFKNQITDLDEAKISVPPLAPSPFIPGTAWHSYKGDCMFFYASDQHAYARRVNEDLTEYRTVDTDELAGCKVKNFDALLNKIAESKPSSSVPVAAVLALSLIRQMERHQLREREEFFRIIPHVLINLDQKRRQEFLVAWNNIDRKQHPDQYLAGICDLALQYTDDSRIVQIARYVSGSNRNEIKERYLHLMAVAGNATVDARRAA
jgi:hypothetical protein